MVVCLVGVLLLCGCPEMKALRIENTRLKQENAALAEKATQSDRRYAAAESARAEAVRTIRMQGNELQEEILRLRGEAEAREAEALERERELLTNIDAERVRAESLGQELATTRQSLTGSETAHSATRQEYDAARGRIADMERELRELRPLTGQLREATRERDEAAAALAAEKKSATALSEKVRGLEGKLAALERAPKPTPGPTPPPAGTVYPQAEARRAVDACLASLGGAAKSLGATACTTQGFAGLAIPADALFESGVITVRDAARPGVAELGKALAKLGGEWRFAVAGHSDNVPVKNLPVYNNTELSFRRAFAVALILEEEGGVAGRSLEVRAYGEGAPRASNATADGRKANRRVEILLVPRSKEN